MEQPLLPVFAESAEPTDDEAFQASATEFDAADHIDEAVALETFEPGDTSFDEMPNQGADASFDDLADEWMTPMAGEIHEEPFALSSTDAEAGDATPRVSEEELNAFMMGESLDAAAETPAAIEETALPATIDAAAAAVDEPGAAMASTATEGAPAEPSESQPQYQPVHRAGVLFGDEGEEPPRRTRWREFAFATVAIGIGGVLTFAAMRGDGNGDAQLDAKSLVTSAPSGKNPVSAPAPAAPAPAAPIPAPEPAPSPVAAPMAPAGTSAPAATAGGRWNAANSEWAGGSTRAVAFEVEANNLVSIWMRSVKPTLVVRCTSGRVEAFVYTSSAARIEPGTDDHTVRYSFDSMPETVQRWRDSEEHDALFAPDGDSIVRRLMDASQFRFVFTPHNAEPASAHFSVAGLRPLIEGAQRQCRVK